MRALTPRCRPRPRRRRLERVVGAVSTCVVLLLAAPSPATAAPSPTITITDAVVTEGNAGVATATFTIQVAPRPKGCCPLQISWTTAAGTATAPGDYTTSSGTVSFTKSIGSKTVSVPIVGDLLDEPNETFVVNLSGLVGSPGVIGDTQGVGTITDDDPLPSVSVGDASASEGNAATSPATFTVSLSTPSGRAVTVNWATSGGTAVPGTDFVAASGVATIPAGATSTTFVVDLKGDVLDEDDESFAVGLSAPVNATVADGSGAGTILDDDPLAALSIGDAAIAEGAAGTSTAMLTVTLSPASGKTVTVDWTTADGSATEPSDYTSGGGTLTFVPGDTTETVSVTVKGDVTAELDETVRVVLSNAQRASVADGVGVVTIQDDELLPVIDIDDASVLEGSSGTTVLRFAVILSHPSASVVTVDWTTTPGTASPGIDYVAGAGTVTFAPLDVAETVDVVVNGDAVYEHDETVHLDLSNATNAPIGDVQGDGTIGNDDAPPSLSVGDASIAEGDAGTTVLTFPVSVTGASALDASVTFATSDGSATAGSDYTTSSGTLVLPAGAAGGTVQVTVVGDPTFEGNETFSLTLADPVESSIADGLAVGTITDDDRIPTTLTVKVAKHPSSVAARGILEPATAGGRVGVTLSRKVNGHYVRVATKTVTVRAIRDRDHDGKQDALYTTAFTRPAAGGSFRIVARFKATTTFAASTARRLFTLPRL